MICNFTLKKKPKRKSSMDEISKGNLIDAICTNVAMKLSIMALCSSHDKEISLGIAKFVCDSVKGMMISDVQEEDIEDSMLKRAGHDPKDIANEIAIQTNVICQDILESISAIHDESGGGDEN